MPGSANVTVQREASRASRITSPAASQSPFSIAV